MSLFNELKRRNVFRVGIAYTVTAWLLLQITDIVFPRIGLPDSAVTLVIALLALGFIPALIFAWAFELTPDGIKKEADVDRSSSIVSTTGRKLDRAIIGVLVVALGYFVFDKFSTDSDSTRVSEAAPQATAAPVTTEVTAAGTAEQESASVPDEPSVAVLPFVNMSSDPEQEYFSDGISEEILNVLTRIPNLKVAARTSSFQFKGKHLDIADIGKQLQVNHLLEGSVRKSGDTLRITAQLIETETGFHLWSETFDRKLEDVFAIQDEIAEAIAVELRALLSDEVDTHSTPVDMQAYELYLKGRGLVAQRREAALFEGVEVLNEAMNIEPDYAPAMATIAKAHAVLPWFSNRVPAGESRKQARKWASRALEIDPKNIEAMAVLGIVLFEVDLNPSGALELLEEAVRLNPGSVAANNFLGDIYLRIGDFQSALKYESRAAELDPLGPVQLTDLANVYAMTGDYDQVIELANRTLELDPAFLNAHQLLSDINFILGNTDQVKRVYKDYISMPDILQNRAEAFEIQVSLAEGDTTTAKNLITKRIKLARAGERPAADVALDTILSGDFDTAGEMLLKAYQERDGTWMFPVWVRLPEQAPDSEPWQEFWSQPGLTDLIDLRRSNGLSANAPTFGSGAK